MRNNFNKEYLSFQNYDYNVYIHLKYVEDLFNDKELKKWKLRIFDVQSVFDQSHILFRFIIDEPLIQFHVVDDRYQLEEIVINFDLTCCQIWYGKGGKEKLEVFTTNEEIYKTIQNNISYLNDNDCLSLEKGDTRVRERMELYRSRRFNINQCISKKKIPKINSIKSSKQPKELGDDIKEYNEVYQQTYFYEKWLALEILRYCTSKNMFINSPGYLISFFCSYKDHKNPMIKLEAILNDIFMKQYDNKTELYNDIKAHIWKFEFYEESKIYNKLRYGYKKTVDMFDNNHAIFDIIMLKKQYRNIFLGKNNNNLVIVFPGYIDDAIGFDIQYLISIFNNQDDNWFFKCENKQIKGTNNMRPVKTGKPYCAIPINKDGMKGLVSVDKIEYLIKTHRFFNQIYFIKYIDTFTHTISHKNTTHNANYVSSNHCQAGSTYMVYELNSDYGYEMPWKEKNIKQGGTCMRKTYR